VIPDPRARRLRFREQLGQGAFGTVYLADLSSGQGLRQRIAVKILNEGPQTADLAARHRDEARLLALLSHDHIVKVIDLIDVNGRLAFMMEYVEGVNAELLVSREGPLPPRAALSVAAAVAGALEAAYNTESPMSQAPLRVVHRDIKPANILISVAGGVKVLDFGIARADFDRDAQTRSEHPGTVPYMAPECFTGADIGRGVDVYALGLTLVRLLTGMPAERLVASEDRFTRQRDQLLLNMAERLSPGPWLDHLVALLRQMLSWNADERPVGPALQDALLNLEDRAPGERLVPLARRAVTPLVGELRRRAQLPDQRLPTDLTLSEGGAAAAISSPPPTLAMSGKVVGLAAGGLAAGIFVGLALLLAGLAWIWHQRATEAGTPTPPTTQQPVVITAPPLRVSSPTTSTPTTSTPSTPTTTSTPAPKTPKASATASTKTAASCAPPAADATAHEITIASSPFGATTTIDGCARGPAPVILRLSDGAHALRLQLDQQTATKAIQVGPDYPTKYTWNAETGRWSSAM